MLYSQISSSVFGWQARTKLALNYPNSQRVGFHLVGLFCRSPLREQAAREQLKWLQILCSVVVWFSLSCSQGRIHPKNNQMKAMCKPCQPILAWMCHICSVISGDCVKVGKGRGRSRKSKSSGKRRCGRSQRKEKSATQLSHHVASHTHQRCNSSCRCRYCWFSHGLLTDGPDVCFLTPDAL